MSMIRALSPNVSSSKDAKHAALPHVLLVLDQFPKTLGGGERILLRLAALLPQHGYRVSILTFSAHPESAGLQSPPCPIYLLPLPPTSYLPTPPPHLHFNLFPTLTPTPI